MQAPACDPRGSVISDGLISLTLSLSLPKPEGARASLIQGMHTTVSGTRTAGTRTADSDMLATCGAAGGVARFATRFAVARCVARLGARFATG